MAGTVCWRRERDVRVCGLPEPCHTAEVRQFIGGITAEQTQQCCALPRQADPLPESLRFRLTCTRAKQYPAADIRLPGQESRLLGLVACCHFTAASATGQPRKSRRYHLSAEYRQFYRRNNLRLETRRSSVLLAVVRGYEQGEASCAGYDDMALTVSRVAQAGLNILSGEIRKVS